MPIRKNMDNREIQNLIKELVEKIMPVKSVSLDGDKTVWFSLEVEEPRFFSDHGGEALFALNHLVRKMIENRISPKESNEEKRPELDILVDINGFQKKRVESVRAIAHMMAERARYFKSNIEVDPMPAFERRIVHEFLADAEDLKTESEGEGHQRRVVIKYVGGI